MRKRETRPIEPALNRIARVASVTAASVGKSSIKRRKERRRPEHTPPLAKTRVEKFQTGSRSKA